MPAREIKGSVYCPECCGIIFCGFIPEDWPDETPLEFVYTNKTTTCEYTGSLGSGTLYKVWGSYNYDGPIPEDTTEIWDGSPIEFIQTLIWNEETSTCVYSYHGWSPEESDPLIVCITSYSDPHGPVPS